MLAQMAISLLWLVIYAIMFAGVAYLVIYGINKFIYAIPTIVEQGIWFIVLILIIIALVTIFAGGGGISHPNFLGK